MRGAGLDPEVGVIDPEGRVEHGARADSAVMGEPRRDVGAVRRPAGMDRLRRRPVGEVGEDPGRHRACDPERPGRRLGVEAAEARNGGGGTEDAADRGRVEAAAVERTGLGHADAAVDLVARRRSPRACPVRARRRALPPRTRPGAITVEMCDPESEWVSSKSRPWHVIALAKAALAAGRRSSRPITVAWASPPSSRIVARPSTPLPVACPASPHPSASRMWSFACSITPVGHVVEAERGREGGDRLGCGHVTPSSRRRYRGACPGPRARRACRPGTSA